MAVGWFLETGNTIIVNSRYTSLKGGWGQKERHFITMGVWVCVFCMLAFKPLLNMSCVRHCSQYWLTYSFENIYIFQNILLLWSLFKQTHSVWGISLSCALVKMFTFSMAHCVMFYLREKRNGIMVSSWSLKSLALGQHMVLAVLPCYCRAGVCLPVLCFVQLTYDTLRESTKWVVSTAMLAGSGVK